MRIYLKTAVEVNEKDDLRCSINCQYIKKIRGNYKCVLYDEDVDTGNDDDTGYGFKRSKGCLEDVVGQPHVGNFGGDL